MTYERFTDRARKLMQLTNQEAQRHNHEAIDAPHILVGLLREGSGVGATVLKQVMNEKVFDGKEFVSLTFDKIVEHLRANMTPGPDMITMGKLPQTAEAKNVIACAIDEAKALRNNYVGTEHILLVLMQSEYTAGVLKVYGVEYGKVLDAVKKTQASASVRTEGTAVDQEKYKAWMAAFPVEMTKKFKAASEREYDSSLRDQFAMEAMKVIVASGRNSLIGSAMYACKIADAMVKELRRMREEK